MKILVCGATGFMGRNIAERFQNLNHEVYGTTGLSRSKVFPINVPSHNIWSIDLTDSGHISEAVGSIKPDVIIQAAATTSGSKDITERPYIHVTDNAVMNSLLLRAAYDYDIKHFVFLSCGVMYQPGEQFREEDDFNEHDEIHKNYFGVGWTKVYIEKMCEFYSRLGKTKHTVIRHSNTYGPYDKYDLEKSHMFGATIRKVMDAKDGDTITVWGNGEDTARDLIYVDDVVDFIETIIEKQTDPYELVNVSYGRAVTVKEVVESIVKHSGKNLMIAYDTSKPSIPTKLALGWVKASSKYQWVPKTWFEDGVEKTIQWYKENMI